MDELLNVLLSLSPAPDTIVLQCMDNLSFFVQNEDGTLTMPVKSRRDNKYHVVEVLKVANKEQTNNLMRLLKPLLTCIKGAKVLLLCCMPRFLHTPCCEEDSHMVEKEMSSITSDLVAMKKTIRSYVFTEKLKDVRVVDPATFCNMSEPSCWEDAVHFTADQYGKIADGLTSLIAGVEEPPEERGRDNPDAKRIRLLSSTVPFGVGGHSAGGRGQGGRGMGRGHGGRLYGRRGRWLGK